MCVKAVLAVADLARKDVNLELIKVGLYGKSATKLDAIVARSSEVRQAFAQMCAHALPSISSLPRSASDSIQ